MTRISDKASNPHFWFSECFVLGLLVLVGNCFAEDASQDHRDVRSDVAKPDIIDSQVLVADQGVDAEEAGEGHCRHNDVIYRHGQLIKTTLTCYKVLCSNSRLSWQPDLDCCLSSSGLLPSDTTQTTSDICQLRVCVKGRWTLRPDFERCCQHDDHWYPVGSSRPMHGGPCTYQLCHNGSWESHYNTTCCFDEVGWHTPGTVLFTTNPCRTKTCRDARWSERDTCCHDRASGRQVATGDIVALDSCTYRLCQQTKWFTRTAFSCCELNGRQYEHGSVVNVGGSVCSQDRCVDGSWHVIRRERVGRERCRHGWHQLGNRCLTGSSPMPWHQAERWCGRLGGHLLTIRRREGWRRLQKAGSLTMWLGLRAHQFSADAPQWRWVDGTPLSAAVLWARHHPKPLPGHVCAYVQNGRAYSAACDEIHGATCATTKCEH